MTTEFTHLRQQLIEQELIPAGITDPAVIAAFSKIPRHEFVPLEYCDQAYENHPLEIGEGQTISQPYTVAFMTQLLQLQPGDKVLEVGAGSGYQAAIIAEIVGAENVYTIERHRELAESAHDNLSRTGYGQVHIAVGDGTLGMSRRSLAKAELPEYAPFDAIIVTAAAPQVPAPLIEQLAPGGKLVIPIGPAFGQQMVRLTKLNDGTFQEEHFGNFVFVPLIGKYGWRDSRSADAISTYEREKSQDKLKYLKKLDDLFE